MACQFRHHSASGSPSGPPRAAEQALRERIEHGDAALLVDADDAGRDAGQDGFHEAAAAVEQVVGAEELVALIAQRVGHVVEGLAEIGEIAGPAARPARGHRDCRWRPDRRR